VGEALLRVALAVVSASGLPEVAQADAVSATDTAVSRRAVRRAEVCRGIRRLLEVAG
jgi:hypothetical protein